MVDKHDRFVTLAEKRVNRVIDDLRLVGNLANRHNYIYSDEEARKICAAIEAEVRAMKRRFFTEEGDDRPKFKL